MERIDGRPSIEHFPNGHPITRPQRILPDEIGDISLVYSFSFHQCRTIDEGLRTELVGAAMLLLLNLWWHGRVLLIIFQGTGYSY